MAYLLTLKSNYIWLDDLDTGKRYEGLAKNVLVRSDLDDSTIFYFDGLNQFDKNVGIAFGDIDVNGNGAFATLTEWQDWYTANTGNFNGGGSAPKYITGLISFNYDTPSVSIEKNTSGFDLSISFDLVGVYYVLSSIGNFQSDNYRMFIPTNLINSDSNEFNFIRLGYDDLAPDALLLQVFDNTPTQIQSPNLNVPFKIEFYV